MLNPMSVHMRSAIENVIAGDLFHPNTNSFVRHPKMARTGYGHGGVMIVSSITALIGMVWLPTNMPIKGMVRGKF